MGSGGKGGGGNSTQIIGYKYYADLHMILCHKLDESCISTDMAFLRFGWKEAYCVSSGGDVVHIGNGGAYQDEDENIALRFDLTVVNTFWKGVTLLDAAEASVFGWSATEERYLFAGTLYYASHPEDIVQPMVSPNIDPDPELHSFVNWGKPKYLFNAWGKLMAVDVDGTTWYIDGSILHHDDDSTGISAGIQGWPAMEKAVCNAYREAAFGLTSDGTVYGAGNEIGEPDRWNNYGGWTDIVDIAMHGKALFGVKSDGTVVYDSTDNYVSAGRFDYIHSYTNVRSVVGKDYKLGIMQSDGLVYFFDDYGSSVSELRACTPEGTQDDFPVSYSMHCSRSNHGTLDGCSSYVCGDYSAAIMEEFSYWNMPNSALDRFSCIRAIMIGEKIAWTGQTSEGGIKIDREDLFGGEESEGGIYAKLQVFPGKEDQEPPSKLVNEAGKPSPQPGYRGVLGVYMDNAMIASMNPYAKPWRFLVANYKSPWRGYWAVVRTETEDIGKNPAHIIYEIITSALGTQQWGLGYSADDVEEEYFAWAAQQLYEEGFGLNAVWDSGVSAEDFIEDILRYIDGVLFVAPTTGKWRLRLFRSNYTVSELPHFTESNVIEINKYGRAGRSEGVNQINLNWTQVNIDNGDFESKRSCIVQNLAAWQSQGQVVTDTEDCPYITNESLAQRVAERMLLQRSYPLAAVEMDVDRLAYNITPGDIINLSWDDYGISRIILRVVSVRYGSVESGIITLSCMEDVHGHNFAMFPAPGTRAGTAFDNTPYPSETLATDADWLDFTPALPETPGIPNSYTEVDDVNESSGGLSQELHDPGEGAPSGWTNPRVPVEDSPYQYAFEMPYYLLIVGGYADEDEIADYDADSGLSALAAARPFPIALGYILHYDTTGTYLESSLKPFTPTGVLSMDIAPDDNSITASSILNWHSIVPGEQALVQIDDELLCLTSVEIESGSGSASSGGAGVIGTGTVLRGCLDTVPKAHEAGARCWFLGKSKYGVAPPVLTEDESINLKAAVKTSYEELDLEDATENTLTIKARPIRPYPVANTQVNGSNFPEALENDSDIVLTWDYRNRLDQTGTYVVGQTDGNIPPETNTILTINYYDIGESSPFLTKTISDGVTQTATMTVAEEYAIRGFNVGNAMLVELTITRDGWENWQSYEVSIPARIISEGWGFGWGHNWGA